MAKLISKGGTSLVDNEEITVTPKKKKNGAKLISRTKKESLEPKINIAKKREWLNLLVVN